MFQKILHQIRRKNIHSVFSYDVFIVLCRYLRVYCKLRQNAVFNLQSFCQTKKLLFLSGALTLPGPVRNLRASLVTNHSVTLMWDPSPEEDNVQQYDIFYKELQDNSNSASLFQGNTVSQEAAP